MSRLRIFAEDAPDRPRAEYAEGEDIRAALADIGVRFERWETRSEVTAGADPETVLEAYRPEIDDLMAAGAIAPATWWA